MTLTFYFGLIYTNAKDRGIAVHSVLIDAEGDVPPQNDTRIGMSI